MTVFTFEEKIIKTDKQTRLLRLVLIVQKNRENMHLCVEQVMSLKQQISMQIAVRFFFCVLNYNGHKEIVLTDH